MTEPTLNTYQLTLDVWDTFDPESPPRRVELTVEGRSLRDLLSRIRNVYVSGDGRTVNLTGGVGPGGHAYPEWELVTAQTIKLGTI
jgi:hypothetical protein